MPDPATVTVLLCFKSKTGRWKPKRVSGKFEFPPFIIHINTLNSAIIVTTGTDSPMMAVLNVLNAAVYYAAT